MPCHITASQRANFTQLQKAMPFYYSGEMKRMMMFGMKMIFCIQMVKARLL